MFNVRRAIAGSNMTGALYLQLITNTLCISSTQKSTYEVRCGLFSAASGYDVFDIKRVGDGGLIIERKYGKQW
jgi:hypothetical protein